MRLADALPVIALTIQAVACSLSIPGYDTKFEVVEVGRGDRVVRKKDIVMFHATGYVAATGQKFWSTRDRTNNPHYPNPWKCTPLHIRCGGWSHLRLIIYALLLLVQFTQALKLSSLAGIKHV